MIRSWFLCRTLAFLICPCVAVTAETSSEAPYVVVLGVAQDGGFPQAGCRKPCCRSAWSDDAVRRNVASVAIVDPVSRQRWMVDATPDFPRQLRMLDDMLPTKDSPGIDGILLTHAHVGHYSGLIHLGREVLGADGISVFAMPRMRQFLETNGPWDQLINLRQVVIERIAAGQEVKLNERISFVPFLVPHRDEYSETVGFRIRGPSHTVLYLPDIDKWERWDVDIEDVLRGVDVAYLDGTFFDQRELPGRDMSEIPHPFVIESIRRFRKLPPHERSKVRFIHANHTNPILIDDSPASAAVREAGHRIAVQGERVGL